MDNDRPKNINSDPIEVAHSDLERTGESVYRSVCPKCKEGVLLVYRTSDHKLSEFDRCVLCGQQFIYTDIQELRKMEEME